ncbi:Small GTPase superfamily ARF/SAR type [Carpediemonas membranifera]|uniref:Small GTPase superfamily ARF/SAR type n=1 Tax=Carpediemonas membranifera TaxID=201153 RepID=A0A8J6AYB8_9EUKA|nr:Small GTPase superfamily ARF/SAR type [Carpediemonas membranifera]|eukprot:KAG9390244.1 Small GTPase superfamily ARF/SAR type [Carpediemonas membranifera]
MHARHSLPFVWSAVVRPWPPDLTPVVNMLGFARDLYDYITFKPEMRVCLLGESGSGKTLFALTMADYFEPKERLQRQTKPTAGLNHIRIATETYRFCIWDLPGNKAFRSMWQRYSSDAHATIILATADCPAKDVRTVYDCLMHIPGRIAIMVRGSADPLMTVWGDIAQTVPLVDPAAMVMTTALLPPMRPAGGLGAVLGSISHCGAETLPPPEIEAVKGTLDGVPVILVGVSEGQKLCDVGERVLAWLSEG